DTKSSGMDIALGYFPGNGQCSNGSGYDTPAVAMGRLPGNAAKIAASLDDNGPDGTGTPIEGALRGAIAFCKKFQTQNPTEKCVAVLVTDGRPEYAAGCSENATDLANIAKAAFEGTNSVRTFAVGLAGADFSLLDKIAQAGGAADCDTTTARFSCDVSSGADKLNVALGKVRDTVTETKTEYQTVLQTVTKTEQRPLACTWAMPEPAAGVAVDKSKVNVTVGGNGLSLPLGKVPAVSSCRAGGWYFDNPSDPKQIVACPETCDAITAAKATDVQIQLGCETSVLVI
ncbi:MAG: vWA domain-containing protein, partial [Polyangiales bacterium]